jgi:ubiquinone/menaquinone biosynthesis C-methylase UbiE/uncharacterized protein YbaR (Trm112 family)
MRSDLLSILRCPQSAQPLELVDASYAGDQIESGWLVAQNGQSKYPIRNGIPRFVPAANYADNFGMQWNKFRRTQLDSFSGQPISANRFWSATGWRPTDLQGQPVLDAGCGAGRFAEIAVSSGARVVALDYSSAADACRENLRHNANIDVVQGDIYALPFAPASFAFVYSLGVLQHTPDVKKAFAALPPMLQQGGRLCVDFYEKSWKNLVSPKYWLRPVTKRVPRTQLFSMLETVVPSLMRVSETVRRIPIAGSSLRRVVPVANYHGALPLNEEQHREWALLDTFDWLSPQFDNPQTANTVRQWLAASGLKDVEVLTAGHLTGRGARRAS